MNKLGKKTDTSLKGVAGYNASMAKPLMDKIFFCDKVDGATLFIDYGCADGALIQFLAGIFPDCYFIGYDENVDMIQAAAQRFNQKIPTEATNWHIPASNKVVAATKNSTTFEVRTDIRFTTDWNEVTAVLRHHTDKKSCLILSSVVHEMYAYRRNIIDQLWKQIWDLKADYIALRDMMVSDTAARPSDSLSVARIRQRYEPEPLRAFESCWGSLNDNWALTHFLLKYRYVNEWDRELRENYLPISIEHLLGLVPTEYAPIFMEHYTLPFLRDRVWEDFGIQLQERTHFKLILKREH